MERWIEFDCPVDDQDYDIDYMPHGSMIDCPVCDGRHCITTRIANAMEVRDDGEVVCINEEWESEPRPEVEVTAAGDRQRSFVDTVTGKTRHEPFEQPTESREEG